jgi:hypothetical protein
MNEEYRYESIEMALRAVKNWGGNLEFVRPDLQTPEMVMIAVRGNSRSLEYVRKLNHPRIG